MQCALCPVLSADREDMRPLHNYRNGVVFPYLICHVPEIRHDLRQEVREKSWTFCLCSLPSASLLQRIEALALRLGFGIRGSINHQNGGSH